MAAEGETTGLVLVAGRYEGIDERLFEREMDEEIAVGDFVVSGGELPALMLIDAVLRLRPGVLNDGDSALQDSFADGLLDCPHYTRPEVYAGTGCRKCCFPGTRGDTRVALAAGAGPHVGTKAGSAGRPRAVGGGAELLAAYRRERTAVRATPDRDECGRGKAGSVKAAVRQGTDVRRQQEARASGDTLRSTRWSTTRSRKTENAA